MTFIKNCSIHFFRGEKIGNFCGKNDIGVHEISNFVEEKLDHSVEIQSAIDF